MAYDSDRHVTVLFSGIQWPGTYDPGETWEWDGNAWTLVATDGPSPRCWHGMTYDAARHVTVLFGGADPNGVLGDMWEWDGTVWTCVSVTGPSPRAHPVLAFDSSRQRVVLFGGCFDDSSHRYYGDTWEWDGSSWSLRSETGPAPRDGHAMAFDELLGAVVLFGGADDPYHLRGDTWAWDGNSWTLLSTTGPSARHVHAMAYDSGRGVTVLFGGNENWSYDGDTWELHTLRFITQPVGAVVKIGQTAEFSVVAQGTGTLVYQWRKNGANLIDGGRISGATASHLMIQPAWLPDAGAYDVVVANDWGSITSVPATLTVTALKGDMNCDGMISFADINPFVLALTGPAAYAARYPNCDYSVGDINDDGVVSFADINPFVRLLSGAH